MDQRDIKKYIYNNNLIENVLTALNCHHIKYHAAKEYYSCARPDGDNIGAINVKNNIYLNVRCWNRDITNPFDNPISIIDLVCYIKNIYWTKALKWICDSIGLDFYEDLSEELPASIKITRELNEMEKDEIKEKEEEIKPLNPKILEYYKPYLSPLFKADGISYHTQQIFGIKYDLESNRYVIPIYDELGTLVGIKARYFYKEVPKDEQKYIYLFGCAKTKILFGLDKAYKYIKEIGIVIVVEAEKGVMKAFSDGIYNVVSIGGHTLSPYQVEKLVALGVKEIVLCYDEDVGRLDNGEIDLKDYYLESEKFIKQQKVSAMIDFNKTILLDKESPIDDILKFRKMFDERINLN